MFLSTVLIICIFWTEVNIPWCVCSCCVYFAARKYVHLNLHESKVYTKYSDTAKLLCNYLCVFFVTGVWRHVSAVAYHSQQCSGDICDDCKWTVQWRYKVGPRCCTVCLLRSTRRAVCSERNAAAGRSSCRLDCSLYRWASYVVDCTEWRLGEFMFRIFVTDGFSSQFYWRCRFEQIIAKYPWTKCPGCANQFAECSTHTAAFKAGEMYFNPWLQIDGHSHGLPSDRGGLHPPIWFSPDSARSAPDQCQS